MDPGDNKVLQNAKERRRKLEDDLANEEQRLTAEMEELTEEHLEKDVIVAQLKKSLVLLSKEEEALKEEKLRLEGELALEEEER